MIYTIQKELDNQFLGARWGCYFTGPINAGEHTAGRKATQTELDIIVGRAFRARYAYMANYKNDLTVRPRQEEISGWDQAANPEWHYLVDNYGELIRLVSKVLRVWINPMQFEIVVMKVSAGNHYGIRAEKRIVINPDPKLDGRIMKYIPFKDVV